MYNTPSKTFFLINWRNTAAALAVSGMLAAYFVFIGRYSTNMPWHDDYVQFLGMYLRLGDEYGWQQLLGVILEQPEWNGLIKSEHRLGFARMVMVLDRTVWGEVSFVRLILIGNAFIVLWVALLWSVSRPARRNWLLMVPVGLLAFSVAHREAALWSSAALLYYPVTFFALAALVVAHGGRRYCWLSILPGLLAVICQANGLLVLPVLVMAFAAAGRRRMALASAGLALFAFILYFVGFQQQLGIPAYPSAYLAVQMVIASWIKALGIVLPSYSGLLGGAIGAIWIYFVASRRWRNNPILFWFGVWLLLSMLAVSVGRASLGDDFVVTQSRYRYYGIALLSVTYLMYVECLNGRRLAVWLSSALTVVIALTSYIGEASIGWAHARKTHMEGLLTSQSYQDEGRKPQFDVWFPKAHEVERIIDYSSRQGIYRLPEGGALVSPRIDPPAAFDSGQEPALLVDLFLPGRRGLAIMGRLETKGRHRCRDGETLIFLDLRGKRYYYEATQFGLAGWDEILKQSCRGFAAYIPLDGLPAGEYRVGVYAARGGKVGGEVYYRSNVVVETEGSK
jgi:hypothetical protein